MQRQHAMRETKTNHIFDLKIWQIRSYTWTTKLPFHFLIILMMTTTSWPAGRPVVWIGYIVMNLVWPPSWVRLASSPPWRIVSIVRGCTRMIRMHNTAGSLASNNQLIITSLCFIIQVQTCLVGSCWADCMCARSIYSISKDAIWFQDRVLLVNKLVVWDTLKSECIYICSATTLSMKRIIPLTAWWSTWTNIILLHLWCVIYH